MSRNMATANQDDAYILDELYVGFNLLRRMLEFDPQKRITAEQVLRGETEGYFSLYLFLCHLKKPQMIEKSANDL